MSKFEDVEKATKAYQKKIAKLCNVTIDDVHVDTLVWRAREIVQECIDNGCEMHQKPYWFLIGKSMDPINWTFYIPDDLVPKS